MEHFQAESEMVRTLESSVKFVRIQLSLWLKFSGI